MKAKYTYWTDCPIHGTKEYPTSGYCEGKKAYCSKCKGFTATSRIITLIHGSSSVRDECDGRCLNGKHSCSCKCRGACHGQGNCNPDLHPKEGE